MQTMDAWLTRHIKDLSNECVAPHKTCACEGLTEFVMWGVWMRNINVCYDSQKYSAGARVMWVDGLV